MSEFKSLKLVAQHKVVKKFVLITLMIFFIFFLLALLPWHQNIKGSGYVTALNPAERDYKVVAPVYGFIESFYVTENEFVKKGDKLFKMKDLDADYESRLESIKEQSVQRHENEGTRLKNIKENLVKQKEVFKITVDIFDKKIKQFLNSLDALEDQKIALKNKERIDKIHYNRSKSLYKEGIESKRTLEVTESTYLHTKAKVHQVVIKVANTKQDLNIVREEKKRFIGEIKIEINNLKNNIISSENLVKSLKQNIEQESISLSRYMSSDIVAKTDGYILRVYQNNENRLIKKGEEILYFAPVVTKKAIRLKLSDFNMPLIKKGLNVRIIFYGWPAIQVSGWPKISHGTYGGVIDSIEQMSHEKGAYYAIITEDKSDGLWPPNNMLKVGTRGSIWVTLSIVPIWYEAWRLMMAQPPVMVEVPE